MQDGSAKTKVQVVRYTPVLRVDFCGGRLVEMLDFGGSGPGGTGCVDGLCRRLTAERVSLEGSGPDEIKVPSGGSDKPAECYLQTRPAFTALL